MNSASTNSRCHLVILPPCDTHRRRGSVIVLVVAVLALLAVIGTVYIVTARAERSSAAANEAAVNLDFAQNAAMGMVTNTIGGEMLDASGFIGGYYTVGPFGTQTGSRFTMPEYDPANPGYSISNLLNRDNSWLVSDLYLPTTASLPASLVANPHYPNYNNMSLLTRFAFDPITGAFDVPFYVPGTNTPNTPTINTFNVVSDPIPTPVPFPTSVQPPTPPGAFVPTASDAFINLLPFSEASGVRYRVGFRILDTSRMANLNVGAPLPLSQFGYIAYKDRIGTYLTSYSTATADPATAGTSKTIFDNMDTAVALDANFGRRGPLWSGPASNAGVSYFYAWQREALAFDLPGGSGFFTGGVTPFDLADELELRAYGDLGTGFRPRPALSTSPSGILWPNNLGVSGVGNLRREWYTTYSTSRELRLLSAPTVANPEFPFTLGGLSTALINGNPVSTPGGNPNVWPTYPARVSANPDISFNIYTSRQAADILAISATNIGTIMERAMIALPHYTQQEACAFAANFLTYRWNSWTMKNASDGTEIWSLPNGPSFVDGQGICFRAADGAGNYVSVDYGFGPDDLRAETSTKIYLGYAAQPFINEIAATVSTVEMPVGSGHFVNTVSDTAIELYNPYGADLDISDYKIRILQGGVGGAPVDIDLATLTTAKYIPPNSYFVLTSSQPGLKSKVDTSQGSTVDSDPTCLLNFGAGQVILLRKYQPRGQSAPTAPSYAAIDQMDYTIFDTAPVQASAQDVNYFIARSNNTNNPDWQATMDTPTSSGVLQNDTAGPAHMTLGDANANDPASTFGGYVLWDRFVGDDYTDTVSQRAFAPGNLVNNAPLNNIQDFNRIMRAASQVDPTTGNPVTPNGSTDLGTIGQQLYTDAYGTLNAEVVNTELPREAMLHFDFRSAPWIFSPHDALVYPGTPFGLPANNTTLAATGTVKPGDIRAVYLLDCLAFIDRVSDPMINLGDGGVGSGQGISKLRIPGQINVNTASAQVLGTIPVLAGTPRWVGAIMAYRWRTTSKDIRIPTFYQSANYDFSNVTAFPGYGIRSLGELEVALSVDPSFNSATTLDDRESLWAAVYNYCTVRSDTFTVYGYLEAVRQNPRIFGAFNNKTVWYSNYGPTGMTDDPQNTTAPLLRVARRRWVAIVDRSYANYNRLNGNGTMNSNFVQPRIVAMKDLPK